MNIWSDCKKLPLTEVLSFIVDNRGKTVPTTTSGHILIATNCIKNDRLYPCYEKIRFLSEDTYQSFFRSHPIPGDILFVCKGTPGRCALVPDPIDFCIAQDMVGLRTNKSIIDNKYLLAVLRSYEIQKFIYNTSVGDVIPHFKKQFFNKLLIPVPPMELQTKIGAFYYSISQKIENNNKINANLEAQAEALFKSWFVDFTPFKDQPFVDSELGPIPQGWKVGKLGDYCEVKSGYAFKSSWWTNKGYKIIKIKNISENGDINLNDCSCVLPENCDKAKNFIANTGDIVIAMTGATIGKFNIIPKIDEKFYINQRVGKFFLGEKPIEKVPYIYCFLKQENISTQIIQKGQGSAQPNISGADIESIPMLTPMSIILKYNKMCQPLFEKILSNRLESKKLSALRDTLLPKLMSGEIKL